MSCHFKCTSSLSDALGRAYDSKNGTDLILATKDGLQIEAHQCVLAYSPFLLKMFEIPEVRYLPKAQIIFPDFGIKSLRTLLRFLYTGEILLEKGSSNLVEFQNLCDLLRIDPAVSKHRSTSTAGTDSERFSCEYCRNRYETRDLLKSHVNREHRNKSSSEKDKRDQKRREEKAKDEKRREKDRQKDKESKKDKDKSRHKSSDKSYKRGETESDRSRGGSTSKKDEKRKDKPDAVDASKKPGTSSLEKEKKLPTVVEADEVGGDEPMPLIENSSSVIEKDLADSQVVEDRVAVVTPLNIEAVETPTNPVKVTVNQVEVNSEENSVKAVETPVTPVETASKPDNIPINPTEAQVKPVEVPAKIVEVPATNSSSSDHLTELKSIDESHAALLEEAEEIAKFIQQSKPVSAPNTIVDVQPDAETEVQISSESEKAKEGLVQAEVDPEAETDVDIPDEEDMEMGDDDEPVVGSSDNVDMFGFKMPDNFDLPDDFYSDIRSSSDKPIAEPNQTIATDMSVSSSLIAEDPDVGEVPHIDIDEPHHIEEESLIIEESLPSTGSPANIPEGEYTSAAGHKMPKLTFQKSEESGPSFSLTNVKIMTLKENLENTRRRLASKFKREEIEKFDEKKDVRRSKKSSKVRRENVVDLTSKRRRGRRPKTTGDNNDDDFIAESWESETGDESGSSWIDKDLSSSFENDKEWDPVKGDDEAQDDVKESAKKAPAVTSSSPSKKRTTQKKHRREERKKRREDRKKKYESERGSTSDEEELEEEVVKVWAKRGAKPSAVPSASRPRLKVSVQMEVEHVMELINYKLRVQHATTSSEEEGSTSKKSKPEKKISTKDVKDKKGEKDKKYDEKKLKRISRLLSSSSSEHEEADEQKDKESGEADTTDGEESKSETETSKRQRSKMTKNSDDNDDSDENDEVKTEQKKRRKRNNSSDESSGERKRKRKKSKKPSSSSESNSNSDSSREPSQSPKKSSSKSDPRQFKRSLSLDASRYGKRPSAFSRQFSSNVGRSMLHPSHQANSFPYNYGLSSENKLLAEKRAKEPDELSKIMKMSFKKKVPSSEAEQKSETETASMPKTSPNSEVKQSAVSGKLTSAPEVPRSQITTGSSMKISPGWASLAARTTMLEPARGNIVLPDRPGPRTTPGIGQPKDAAGFSRPFPPNRPGMSNMAFPPISPYQMQLPPPHKRLSPTRSGSVDPRTMAVPPQQFGFGQPPPTRYPMIAPRPAESAYQQQQPAPHRFGHHMGPGVSAPQNNRQ